MVDISVVLATYCESTKFAGIGIFCFLSFLSFMLSRKGDLFIFPSQLRHSVPKQETDDERIMVAGNIWYNFKSENVDIAKINADCKFIVQDDYEKVDDV